MPFQRCTQSAKKNSGKSIKNTHFHHAHSILNDINSNISELCNEIKDTLSTYTSDTNAAITILSPTSTLTHSANAVTTNDLIQMIIQMQHQLNQHQGSTPNQSNTSISSANNRKKKSTFIRNPITVGRTVRADTTTEIVETKGRVIWIMQHLGTKWAEALNSVNQWKRWNPLTAWDGCSI